MLSYVAISFIVSRWRYHDLWTGVVPVILLSLLLLALYVATVEHLEAEARADGRRRMKAMLNMAQRRNGFVTSVSLHARKSISRAVSGLQERRRSATRRRSWFGLMGESAAVVVTALGLGEDAGGDNAEGTTSPTQSAGSPNSYSQVTEGRIGEVRHSVIMNENLPQAAQSDTDSNNENALTANELKSLSGSIDAYAWKAWGVQYQKDQEKASLLHKVAASMHPFLEDASPLSSFSADHRSTFWRRIAHTFPGCIAFVIGLNENERRNMFGVLAKLEWYLRAKRIVGDHAIEALIEESARSTMLYSLLAASPGDKSLSDFIKSCLSAQRGDKSDDDAGIITDRVFQAALIPTRRRNVNRVVPADALKVSETDHRNLTIYTTEREAIDHLEKRLRCHQHGNDVEGKGEMPRVDASCEAVYAAHDGNEEEETEGVGSNAITSTITELLPQEGVSDEAADREREDTDSRGPDSPLVAPTYRSITNAAVILEAPRPDDDVFQEQTDRQQDKQDTGAGDTPPLTVVDCDTYN